MDNHEKWLEAVSAYADGECSDREGAAVEAHLNECPDCRTWLEQIRADQEVFAESLMARQADILDPVMKRVTEMFAPQKQPETRKTPMTTRRFIEVFGVVAVCAVMVMILFPVFAKSRSKATATVCLSNVKQLALATQMWASDHDGYLPNALTWAEDILPYVGSDVSLFHCPKDPVQDNISYAMVPKWSGAKLDEIPNAAETVIIYEVDAYGRAVLRHDGMMSVGYADTHVKWIRDIPAGLGVGRTGLLSRRGEPQAAPAAPKVRLQHVTTLEDEQIASKSISGTIIVADGQTKPMDEFAEAPAPERLGEGYEALPRALITTEAPTTTGIQPVEPDRDWGIRRQIQLGYDAALEVWVKNLQESVVIAERTFYEHSGFVLDSTMVQVETLRQPRRAQIVGKVPKEKVADAINALAALGWVAQRDIMGEDLTDQYTQTTRSLTKLQEQVNKLTEERGSASKARRAEIDRQIKALKDDLGPAQDAYHDVQKELVLSTISARLVEKTPRAPLGKSLRAAWESFAYAIARVGVVLAWVLLFGLFLVPVIVAVIIYRRWRRQ